MVRRVVILVVVVGSNGVPGQIQWEGLGAVGLFLLLGYLGENVSLKGLPSGQEAMIKLYY